MAVNTITESILFDVGEERQRQVQKWGIQHRPGITTEPKVAKKLADRARNLCDRAEAVGPLPGFTGGASWESILCEETFEALAESQDKVALRKELVQCAAVLVAWIEDLDTH